MRCPRCDESIDSVLIILTVESSLDYLDVDIGKHWERSDSDVTNAIAHCPECLSILTGEQLEQMGVPEDLIKGIPIVS